MICISFVHLPALQHVSIRALLKSCLPHRLLFRSYIFPLYRRLPSEILWSHLFISGSELHAQLVWTSFIIVDIVIQYDLHKGRKSLFYQKISLHGVAIISWINDLYRFSLYQGNSSTKDCYQFPVLKSNLGGYRFEESHEAEQKWHEFWWHRTGY
jgi:hypothetical protein